MLLKDQIPSLIRLSAKRYLQTVPVTPVSKISPSVFGSLPSSSASPAIQHNNGLESQNAVNATVKSWASHSMPDSESSSPHFTRAAKPFSKASKPLTRPFVPPASPSASQLKQQQQKLADSTISPTETSTVSKIAATTEKTITNATKVSDPNVSSATATPTTAIKPKRKLRPRKAAINLSPSAVEHLHALLDSPQPKLIRIGVRNRGCSGLTYHLEYVTEPGKFDEEIVQDGVKVLIDSKALFSIIGSEMDWVDDKLASRFVFHNPNSKGECGCGESFMV